MVGVTVFPFFFFYTIYFSERDKPRQGPAPLLQRSSGLPRAVSFARNCRPFFLRLATHQEKLLSTSCRSSRPLLCSVKKVNNAKCLKYKKSMNSVCVGSRMNMYFVYWEKKDDKRDVGRRHWAARKKRADAAPARHKAHPRSNPHTEKPEIERERERESEKKIKQKNCLAHLRKRNLLKGTLRIVNVLGRHGDRGAERTVEHAKDLHDAVNDP